MISKRSGGVREIQSPRRELKFIQRNLATCLQEVYSPRLCVHGFTSGASIQTNATAHFPARYVFNVDLKDFFPSINFGRIRGLFLAYPLSLNRLAATTLAQICCHEGKLPQGAPTSPVLSNMICARLDRQLMQLARAHKCFYTRYADDITFSKRKADFPAEIGHLTSDGAGVGKELRHIIEANGFAINDSKVHLQSNLRRQRVTGLIVNRKVNVQRRFVRQIRAMIHAWSKFGEEAANDVHQKLYYRRAGKSSGPSKIRNVIHGKLDFLKMVKGVDDKVYKNLQSQFVRICPEYRTVMVKENNKMLSRDVFISHASEDKSEIARPLADSLISCGISVWYDEYEIRLGDSLRQKIDEGLSNAKFGIVILSPSFFRKRWPRKELDGLTALEDSDGRKRVLPIWHKLSSQEVTSYSPMLGGLRAAKSSEGLDSIVNEIRTILEDQ